MLDNAIKPTPLFSPSSLPSSELNTICLADLAYLVMLFILQLMQMLDIREDVKHNGVCFVELYNILATQDTFFFATELSDGVSVPPWWMIEIMDSSDITSTLKPVYQQFMAAKISTEWSSIGMCFTRVIMWSLKSVKSFPGGQKIHFISSISKIQSQTWYQCI